MPDAGTYNLEQFCKELEHLISQGKENPVFLEEAQVLLKKLLPNWEFVGDVLAKMVDDDTFLKERIGTIDRNDIMLYLSPQGSFSMRLFVWLPSVEYPIHEHGSWGIIGGYANKSYEIKYRRLDDGSVADYARVEETAQKIINPGDSSYVLPFADGIHQMGSRDDRIALTVHVYGKPLRKGFVQCFNKQENSTYNLITPELEKRLFAVRALGAIGGDIAKAYIEKAFHDSHPLVRWESIAAMARVDRDSWLTLLQKADNDASVELKNKARATINQI